MTRKGVPNFDFNFKKAQKERLGMIPVEIQGNKATVAQYYGIKNITEFTSNLLKGVKRERFA